jgi:hypothetical protein
MIQSDGLTGWHIPKTSQSDAQHGLNQMPETANSGADLADANGLGQLNPSPLASDQ